MNPAEKAEKAATVKAEKAEEKAAAEKATAVLAAEEAAEKEATLAAEKAAAAREAAEKAAEEADVKAAAEKAVAEKAAVKAAADKADAFKFKVGDHVKYPAADDGSFPEGTGTVAAASGISPTDDNTYKVKSDSNLKLLAHDFKEAELEAVS